MTPRIWTRYNAATKRHETIDLATTTLHAGQTMVQLFWCTQAKRYVTIPGASLHTVQTDGSLALDRH